jgi:hypothetical protein
VVPCRNTDRAIFDASDARAMTNAGSDRLLSLAARVEHFDVTFDARGTRLTRDETAVTLARRSDVPVPSGVPLGRARELVIASGVRGYWPPNGVAFTGAPGSGKTTLLRALANGDWVRGEFADVVFATAAGQPWQDVLVQIFRALHVPGGIEFLPTSTSSFADVAASPLAVFLDDAEPPFDLRSLVRALPKATFFVAATSAPTWFSAHALGAFGDDDAAALLEELRPGERFFVDDVRAIRRAARGLPGRIVQLDALAAFAKQPLRELANAVLGSSLDDVVAARVRAFGPDAAAAYDAIDCYGPAATDVPTPETADLERAGLIVPDGRGWRVPFRPAARERVASRADDWSFADGVAILRRTLARTIARIDDPSRLQGLAAVADRALALERYADAIALGRGAAVGFARCGAWLQWEAMLDLVRTAAQRTDDRTARAWALHETGTAKAMLGEDREARALLGAALVLRREAGDASGLAASEANLAAAEAQPAAAPVPPPAAKRRWLFPVGVVGAALGTVVIVVAAFAARALHVGNASSAADHRIATRVARPHANPQVVRPSVASTPRPRTTPRPQPTTRATPRPQPTTRATPRPQPTPRAAAASPRGRARAEPAESLGAPAILTFYAGSSVIHAGQKTTLCMKLRPAERVRLTAIGDDDRALPVPRGAYRGVACVAIAPEASTRYTLEATTGSERAFRAVAVDVFPATPASQASP